MKICFVRCQLPCPPQSPVFPVFFQRSGKMPRKAATANYKCAIPKPSPALVWPQPSPAPHGGIPHLLDYLLTREIPPSAHNHGSAPSWNCTFKKAIFTANTQLLTKTDNSERTFEKQQQLQKVKCQLLKDRYQLCCRTRKIGALFRFFALKKFLCYNINRK